MHLQKFTKSATGNMLAHYNRKNNDSRNYGNKDIDKSKTCLNYNLAPDRGQDEITYMNERLKEVKVFNRKDVVHMIDCVVTKPKDYDGRNEDFFKASYEALNNKFGGEKNVISAYVHLDEKGQPHMHYAFMPIVDSVNKKGEQIEKLCANEVMTRELLRELHPYMERELSRELGEPVHMLNEATRDGNKTVTELKRESELKEQEQLKEQTQKERDNLQATRDALDFTKEDLQTKRKELEKLNSKPFREPQTYKFPFNKGEYYLKEDVQTYMEQMRARDISHEMELREMRTQRDNAIKERDSKQRAINEYQHFINSPEMLKGQLEQIERYERQRQEPEREHTHQRSFSRGR